MPQGFANGLQTAFTYLTVAQVRAAGIPATGDFGIDDDRLRALIREVSHWINRLTDQWFQPVRLVHKCEGARSSVAHFPNLIPILDLFALRLGREDLFVVELPTIAYQRKPRYVMMVSRGFHLPEYPLFVIMDGVFGWLVDDFAPVKTTTTAAVALGATEVSVTSVVGINVGDSVLVGRDPEPNSGPIIVTGVQSSPPKIFCEATMFSVTSVGMPVVKYGRIPDGIQRAALLMVRDRVQKIGDIDTAESPFGIGTRLTSESVEGYSYGLAPMPAVNGYGGGGDWTTGNAEVDSILQLYCTPAMIVGAV